MSADPTHPTAEELFRQVKPRTDSLSLATVYATLEKFCSVGLARKMPTPQGCCRYDADTSEHAHLRYDDGTIADLPAEVGAALLRSVPRQVLDTIEDDLGIRIDGLSIHVLARRRAPEESGRA